MNINYMHNKNDEYASFSVNGNILTVNEIDYNLEDLQKDEQNIIDIKEDNRFVANIIINGIEYEEVQTDEKDEFENYIYTRVKKAFEIEKIKLNLWKTNIAEIAKQNKSEEIN